MLGRRAPALGREPLDLAVEVFPGQADQPAPEPLVGPMLHELAVRVQQRPPSTTSSGVTVPGARSPTASR